MNITRRDFSLRLAALTGAPALLITTGCSKTGTIETIVSAAELAVSTLATLEPNIPGIALAAKYLDAVGQGVDCAIAERQSTDPPALQVSKITACVSAAVLPVLPAGTPTVIGNVLSKVAQAVANYLSNLTVPAAPAALVKTDGGNLPALHARVKVMRQKCSKLWK